MYSPLVPASSDSKQATDRERDLRSPAVHLPPTKPLAMPDAVTQQRQAQMFENIIGSIDRALQQQTPLEGGFGETVQMQLDWDNNKFLQTTAYQPPMPYQNPYAQLRTAIFNYHNQRQQNNDVHPDTIDELSKIHQYAKAFLDDYQANNNQPNARIVNNTQRLINDAAKELDVQVRARFNQAAGNDDATKIGNVNQDLGARAQGKENIHLLKYQKLVGFDGARANKVTDINGAMIIQNYMARGDMYHVRTVLGLYPQLKLLIYNIPKPIAAIRNDNDRTKNLQNADKWKQACMLANYYGMPNRVYYTNADGVSGKGEKGHAYRFFEDFSKNGNNAYNTTYYIDVGGCTTLLGLTFGEARETSDQAFGQVMNRSKEAIAPAPQNNDGRASKNEIINCLKAEGFKTNTKYMIINYRDSGHKNIQKKLANANDRNQTIQDYDPKQPTPEGNHPEMDTGRTGVEQLGAIATKLGYKPVYMGEEPSNANKPHLLKYWSWSYQNNKICRGGRSAEAYFIRVLGEAFNVKYMGMRSGVTDQVALSGIPVISIDIDNFTRKSIPQLYDEPGYKLGSDEVAHSWGRGSKLEYGMGRHYGRAFLQENRDLKTFRNDDQWSGSFGNTDRANLEDAASFYFEEDHDEIRHKTHPLHPDQLDTVPSDDDQELRSGLMGIMDSSLNPQLVLSEAKAIIGNGQNEAKALKAVRHLASYIELSYRNDMPDEKKKEWAKFGKSALAMLPNDEMRSLLMRQSKTMGAKRKGLAANRFRTNVAKYAPLQKACRDTISTLDNLQKKLNQNKRSYAIDPTTFAVHKVVVLDILKVLDRGAYKNVGQGNQIYAAQKIRLTGEIVKAKQTLNTYKAKVIQDKKNGWVFNKSQIGLMITDLNNIDLSNLG